MQKQQRSGRRFRSAVLPYLDDAYTLALFFLRNKADAEDAVQECYLRALNHFDTYCGPAVKPWLFAILRNVCYSELARRGRRELPVDLTSLEPATEELLWQEPQAATNSAIIARQESAAIRRLVEALPAKFREAILLREFSGMSYRDIAEVTRVPVGTVMSRLARGRRHAACRMEDIGRARPRLAARQVSSKIAAGCAAVLTD